MLRSFVGIAPHEHIYVGGELMAMNFLQSFVYVVASVFVTEQIMEILIKCYRTMLWTIIDQK